MTYENPVDSQTNDQQHPTQTLDGAFAAHRDAETIVDVEEPTQQLVLFRIGGQRFALPGSAVNEILPHDQPVYFVPGLP
ncbi:MAG TPA: chemotaxis protein CheW, partial [Halomonas sp.]|nr:chemotaxis protein CheW [Halomonas sp.]